jgi:hypothetical protein
LREMFVEWPASVPAFSPPATDGAFVEAEGGDDGPNRAAVRQRGHDDDPRLVRLMHPVERGALGGGKGSPASFAAVAALSLSVDHDVTFSAGSGVGPATLVVAKSLPRVHDVHLLSLTSDTGEGAVVGPAFFQLIPHPRLRGVLPGHGL